MQTLYRPRRQKKRKIINQENNKNNQIQPPKKKSNLVARKSTAGRLNTTLSREKDYCCTKCHMLFWTPGELYEHTKRKHTKTLLINDEEQNDDIPLHDLTTKEFTNSTDGAAESKDDEIEIIQVIENPKPEEKSTDTHLKEKYYYFCLDCEEEKGEGCRVPISADIAGHIITKQHTRFTPIENCFPSMKNKNLLSLSNISYSRKWNKKVIQDWKRNMTAQLNAATSGLDVQFKYEKPRRCLQVLCQFVAEDPADMFKHIREKHVKGSM